MNIWDCNSLDSFTTEQLEDFCDTEIRIHKSNLLSQEFNLRKKRYSSKCGCYDDEIDLTFRLDIYHRPEYESFITDFVRNFEKLDDEGRDDLIERVKSL